MTPPHAATPDDRQPHRFHLRLPLQSRSCCTYSGKPRVYLLAQLAHAATGLGRSRSEAGRTRAPPTTGAPIPLREHRVSLSLRIEGVAEAGAGVQEIGIRGGTAKFAAQGANHSVEGIGVVTRREIGSPDRSGAGLARADRAGMGEEVAQQSAARSELAPAVRHRAGSAGSARRSAGGRAGTTVGSGSTKRSTGVAAPRPIASRSASRCGAEIRSPLTKVPLALPASRSR